LSGDLEHFVRFRVVDSILYGFLYSEEKKVKTITVPISNIIEVEIIEETWIKIDGSFIDNDEKIFADQIIVQFNKSSTRKDLYSVLTETRTQAPQSSNKNDQSKHIFSAIVSGMIEGQAVNKPCVVDFSDCINIIDAKSGNELIKYKEEQLQAAEVFESLILLKSVDSQIFIALDDPLYKMPSETKSLFLGFVYKSRRKNPLVLFMKDFDEEHFEVFSLSNENHKIKAQGSKWNATLSEKQITSASLDDDGYFIKIPGDTKKKRAKKKPGGFVFNEHSFVFASYHTRLPIMEQKLKNLAVPKLRYRWSELFSGYLLFNLFGDIYSLIYQVKECEDTFEKACILKLGLEGVRKYLYKVEHVFPVHIENSGTLWALDLGFSQKTLITDKMANAFKAWLLSTISGILRIIGESEKEIRYIDRFLTDAILFENIDQETNWMALGGNFVGNFAMGFINPIYGISKGFSEAGNNKQVKISEEKNTAKIEYYTQKAYESLQLGFETGIPNMIAQTNRFAFEWAMGIFNNEKRLFNETEIIENKLQDAYIRKINRLIAWGDVPFNQQLKRNDIVGELTNLPQCTNTDIFSQI
jgi:hypothetical protein